YALERWGLSRSYAHRLIKSGEIVEDVLKTLGDVPLPANEAQVRPLIGLPRNTIRKVWKQVAKEAKSSKVTTSLVVQVIGKIIAREQPQVRQNGLSYTQQEIHMFLARTAEAVNSADFMSALEHITAAQV